MAYKIFAIPIYLLPISLIFGPAPTDFNISLISLMTLIYLIFNFNKNLITYPIIFIIFLFIIFFLLINISSIISNNYFFSYEYSLVYFRFFLFSIGIFLSLKLKFLNIRYLIYIFILVYILIFIDGYYQFFNGYNILGYKYDGDRLSGIFGEEKILGSFLSRTYPFFFGLASYYYKDKFIISLAFIGFILSDVLVVISGDRTAAFYLLLSSLIIVCLTKRFQLIRILTIIISSFLILIIILNSPTITERIYSKTIRDISKNDQSELHAENLNLSFLNKFYFFTSTHHGYLLTSLEMFKHNPIFGVGPKLYREECKKNIYKIEGKENCNTHPHNTYLQLLAETGLITTLIVFLLFIYLIFTFSSQLYYKFSKSNHILSDPNICFLTCLFITLFPFIPTGNFFSNWLNAIYYLPLGFIMYEITNKSENENIIGNK